MGRPPKYRPAGSEQDAADDYAPSDAELGIGEETEAPDQSANARIAAAMSDTVIAAAIEEHIRNEVERRANGNPAGPDFLAAMKALGEQIASSINRSTSATIEQMPGHVKPLPVEEVEARAAAFVEMKAILTDISRQYWAFQDAGQGHKAEALAPKYLLEEDSFLPAAVGHAMSQAGATIRWFGPPGVHMRPQNELATKISELAWRSIGNEGRMDASHLIDIGSGQMPSTPGAEIGQMPVQPRRSGHIPAVAVAEDGIADLSAKTIVGPVVTVVQGPYGHSPYNLPQRM